MQVDASPVDVNVLRATLGARPLPYPCAGAVRGHMQCYGPLAVPVFAGRIDAVPALSTEGPAPRGDVLPTEAPVPQGDSPPSVSTDARVQPVSMAVPVPPRCTPLDHSASPAAVPAVSTEALISLEQGPRAVRTQGPVPPPQASLQRQAAVPAVSTGEPSPLQEASLRREAPDPSLEAPVSLPSVSHGQDAAAPVEGTAASVPTQPISPGRDDAAEALRSMRDAGKSVALAYDRVTFKCTSHASNSS
jgi:hypothetical protein